MVRRALIRFKFKNRINCVRPRTSLCVNITYLFIIKLYGMAIAKSTIKAAVFLFIIMPRNVVSGDKNIYLKAMV